MVARSAPAGRSARFILALAAVVGCGGKTIHLGDGCTPGQVNANQVLWIGDGWITVPGDQHTRVRDLAQAAHVISAADDYVIAATAPATMAMIASQYSAEEASAAVKVIVMDGGTFDTLSANGSDASVASVVDTFTQLLSTVASDGTVEDIIYFLCPELPMIKGVAALRPPLQQACRESAVPCHFIDLQPLWAGHPEYTADNEILPSGSGATVIADAIWGVMQDNCIAQ